LPFTREKSLITLKKSNFFIDECNVCIRQVFSLLKNVVVVVGVADVVVAVDVVIAVATPLVIAHSVPHSAY
jgi:hypothetical protein